MEKLKKNAQEQCDDIRGFVRKLPSDIRMEDRIRDRSHPDGGWVANFSFPRFRNGKLWFKGDTGWNPDVLFRHDGAIVFRPRRPAEGLDTIFHNVDSFTRYLGELERSDSPDAFIRRSIDSDLTQERTIEDTKEKTARERRARFLPRVLKLGGKEVNGELSFALSFENKDRGAIRWVDGREISPVPEKEFAKITFHPVGENGKVDWYAKDTAFQNSEYQYEANYKGETIHLFVPTDNSKAPSLSYLGKRVTLTLTGDEFVHDIQPEFAKIRAMVHAKKEQDKQEKEKKNQAEKVRANNIREMAQVSRTLWNMVGKKDWEAIEKEAETLLTKVENKYVFKKGDVERDVLRMTDNTLLVFLYDSAGHKKSEKKVEIWVIMEEEGEENEDLMSTREGEESGPTIKETETSFFAPKNGDDSTGLVKKRRTKELRGDVLLAEREETYFSNGNERRTEERKFDDNGKMESSHVRTYYEEGQEKANEQETFTEGERTFYSLREYYADGVPKVEKNIRYEDGKVVSGEKLGFHEDGKAKRYHSRWNVARENWEKIPFVERVPFLADERELQEFRIVRRTGDLPDYGIREARVMRREDISFFPREGYRIPLKNREDETVGEIASPEYILEITYKRSGQGEPKLYGIMYDQKLYTYDRSLREFRESRLYDIDYEKKQYYLRDESGERGEKPIALGEEEGRMNETRLDIKSDDRDMKEGDDERTGNRSAESDQEANRVASEEIIEEARKEILSTLHTVKKSLEAEMGENQKDLKQEVINSVFARLEEDLNTNPPSLPEFSEVQALAVQEAELKAPFLIKSFVGPEVEKFFSGKKDIQKQYETARVKLENAIDLAENNSSHDRETV